MAFRIRTIELTADGREIVREKPVDKPQLTIGRAAENDIHLPDLAVEPNHARLAEMGGGRIGVEATGTLGFTLDGASARSASIDSRTGGELGFGTYRIALSQADDAVLLTVRQVDTTSEAAAAFDEKRSFTLTGVMPGKRAVSWVLGLLVLAAFLALPIASNLMRSSDPKARVIGDASWSSGPLSQAHHGLEHRCTACHVKPFEAVRNETCRNCHADSHDHAPTMRLARVQGDFPLGQALLWKVAHMFGKPGPGACTDCHTEHEGSGRMEPTRQQFCADCHATLREKITDTKLGNAGDFGKLHPQFTPQIATVPGGPASAHISLDAHPREASGLTFPHRMHLDPLGGVARMAASFGGAHGYGRGLTCKDCHHPTEDGVRFLPVRMERDCEGCHSLVYDRVGATFRTLKHGDIDQMIADLSLARPSAQVSPSGSVRAPMPQGRPITRTSPRPAVAVCCNGPSPNRAFAASAIRL